MVSLTEELISRAISKSRPEKLTLPVPPRVDHADHVVKTALSGHAKLAADHLLHREMVGHLAETVGAIVRQLNLEFIAAKVEPGDSEAAAEEKVVRRHRCYEVLFEIYLNLVGVESRWVGFDRSEVEASLSYIEAAVREWEALERQEYGAPLVAKATISRILSDLKRVRKGDSMLAHMAERIEGSLSPDDLTGSFLRSAREAIEGNPYFKLSLMGACKFGNDYALGLRWLRHLGYVQVSTNPVLAAIAYDERPELWEEFREVALQHPEWLKDPEGHADEIAMEATRVGLMENFLVFRPPFLLSGYHDGLVSYQLNPNIAADVERSLSDALKFYMRTQEFLKVYDAYLLWGYSAAQERGRPNIVFKVAGAYPSAIEIAKRLNERGMGTNITVVYTVSQEVLLGVAEMEGMAKAAKRGVKVTQVYITNMGGRLEDHLREVEAEELLVKALERVSDKEAFLRGLAESLGALGEYEQAGGKPLEERARLLCRKKYLRKLTDERFVRALASSGLYASEEEALKDLSRREEVIGYAGILVTQRVYRILFSPENRPKWLAYIKRKWGVTDEQAEEILDRIDVLPASKRKPIDTIYTLASRNMTHTEFPNHQLKVFLEFEKGRVDVNDVLESVMVDHGHEVLEELMKRPDFVKAYEVPPELAEILKEVGVEGDFGSGGLRVEEWPSYGPCVKTMTQFIEGYERFKRKCVEFVRELARAAK